MDNDNLSRAQQLLRDDNRAQRVNGAAAGIADDVGVTLLQPQGLCGVQSSIHTCYNSDLAIS
jgi:hypothetical protein